jgi:hypothetical protein
LVDESISGIMNWGCALLVRSLRCLWLLVVRSRRLLRIAGRVWIIHKVSGRCKTCRVWLLRRVLRLPRLALSLGREDRIWKRGWCCRVGTAIREGRSVIIQIQIEPVAIVVVLHLECSCVDLLMPLGLDRGGICIPMAFVLCVGVDVYYLSTPLVCLRERSCGETLNVSRPQVCSIFAEDSNLRWC